jgi:hypothetical protein
MASQPGAARSSVRLAKLPVRDARIENGLQKNITKGKKPVANLVEQFEGQTSDARSTPKAFVRNHGRHPAPVQTAQLRSEHGSQDVHSSSSPGSKKHTLSGPASPLVSTSAALSALAQGDELMGWSDRKSDAHRLEVASAVLNAVGGAEQLPGFISDIIGNRDADVQTIVASALAQKVQKLTNKDPLSAVKVIDTPSTAKCTAFKDEVQCSNGKYFMAAYKFPDLFTPL